MNSQLDASHPASKSSSISSFVESEHLSQRVRAVAAYPTWLGEGPGRDSASRHLVKAGLYLG